MANIVGVASMPNRCSFTWTSTMNRQLGQGSGARPDYGHQHPRDTEWKRSVAFFTNTTGCVGTWSCTPTTTNLSFKVGSGTDAFRVAFGEATRLVTWANSMRNIGAAARLKPLLCNLAPLFATGTSSLTMNAKWEQMASW